MGRFTVVLIALALTVFALIDCIQTPPERAKHLPKPLWLVLVVILPVVGPAAWLLVGKQRSGGQASWTPPPVVAPDDDPEFLRQLRDIDAQHEDMLKSWEDDLRRREDDLRGDDPPAPDDDTKD